MQLKWRPTTSIVNDRSFCLPEIGSSFWMFKWNITSQSVKSFLSPRLVTVKEHKKENIWYPDAVTSIVVIDSDGNEHVIGSFNQYNEQNNLERGCTDVAYGFTTKEECMTLYKSYREHESRRINRVIKNLNNILSVIYEN